MFYLVLTLNCNLWINFKTSTFWFLCSYARQIDETDSITKEHQSNLKNKSILARVFDVFLLILAFSVHSTFDGISIGVQSGSRIWTVLIAILSHKLLIAFILSVQIYEQSQNPNDRNKKTAKAILWVFMAMFAAMSPIGILIVILMDNVASNGEQQLHIIVLAAISAGTIIYITFLEIIDKSKSRPVLSGFVQWVALVIGFGLMHLVASCFPE